jgi:hypothetical protein
MQNRFNMLVKSSLAVVGLNTFKSIKSLPCNRKSLIIIGVVFLILVSMIFMKISNMSNNVKYELDKISQSNSPPQHIIQCQQPKIVQLKCDSIDSPYPSLPSLVDQCLPLRDNFKRPAQMTQNMPNLEGYILRNTSGFYHIRSYGYEKKRITSFKMPIIEPESKNIVCSDAGFLTNWNFICSDNGRFQPISNYDSQIELMNLDCGYMDYGSRVREAAGNIYSEKGFIHKPRDVVFKENDIHIDLDELAGVGPMSYPGAFGHWPTQIAPKLLLFWNELPKGIPLALPVETKGWLSQFFDKGILDRYRHPVIFHNGGQIVFRARRMWFMTNFDYQPETMGLVTSYLWHYTRKVYTDKIYNHIEPRETIVIINRNADAGSRRFDNYNELVDKIKSVYGNDYEIVEYVAKGKSFFESGAIFFNARLVIAAHGAGLSHLISMRPGTGVIEISILDHSFQPPSMYYELAMGCGLHYGMAMYPGSAYSGGIRPNVDEIIRLISKVMDTMKKGGYIHKIKI